MEAVSAVIPVYNVVSYLERCLRSCLAQTHPFDEIILVDDGSTDGSGGLCERYAAENDFIHVVHQVNAGLSAARNTGIARATHDLITFIDSDDWIAPSFLETLLKLMERTCADIAMCGMVRASSIQEYDQELKKTPEAKIRTFTAEEFLDIMLRIKGNRSVHYAWGKVYRRKVLEPEHFPVGLYNEDIEGCFKALLNSHCVVETSAPLYCYFRNPTSITGERFGENYLSLGDAWERVRLIAMERRPDLVEKVEYNQRRTDFTILCDMLIHGNQDTDTRYEEERRLIQGRLNRNLGMLLRGPMALNRKIFTVLLAKAYVPVRGAMRLKGRVT